MGKNNPKLFTITWKQNMKKTVLLINSIIVFTIIIGLNGCKDNSVGPVTGTSTISGTIEENNAGMFTPLKGITVYLINLNYKVDTSLTADNSAAIVDTAVTDSSGKYSMNNIEVGRYGVVPAPSVNSYVFTLADGSGTDTVTVNNTPKNYSVSFNAFSLATADQSSFTVNFKNINEPSKYSWSIFVYRQRFIFFVPDWSMGPYFITTIHTSENFEYGSTWLAYTLTNNLRCDCDSNGVVQFSFYIIQPLSGCPSSTTWQVDWAAKTATKIN